MSRDKPGANAAPGRQPLSLRPARWRASLSATGLVLLIALLGLVLRLLRLDFQPLWWDEGYSVWFATHSLPQMVALTAQDIHPPLYYGLLHGWTLLAGAGPVAVRLVSVAAGIAALPLAYATGREIAGSRRTGILAAFLLAINPLHVYYSQEVRMYGLVALFSLGILLSAWRFMAGSERGGGRWLPAYVLLVAAALYTQYYAVFLPIGLTLYALWLWRGDRRKLGMWFAAQGAAALLYLPWVLYAAPRLVLYVSQKVVADDDRPLGLVLYVGRHLAAFVAGHLEGPLAAWWPLALVLLLPLALAARPSKSSRSGPGAQLPGSDAAASPAAFLGTVLTTALVLGWVIGLRYPFFPERGERLLLLALPPFVLLAAHALDRLSRGLRPVYLASLALFVAISAAGLAGFYLTPRYAGEDYRPLIARSVEQGLPEDSVYCVYPWQVGYWRSYGGESGPQAVLAGSDELDAAVQGELEAALERGRVWFPAHLALGAILETQIEDYLAGRALPFANEWYGPGTRLSAWAPVAATSAGPAVDASFMTSTGIRLVLERLGAEQTVRAENAVFPVTLSWQASEAPPLLGVSVRLVDDLGQIWAQHDYEPLGANGEGGAGGGWRAEDSFGVLTPAGTPPGRYHVEVAVTEADAERTLQATSAGGVTGPAVRIHEVNVLPADRTLGPERLPVAVRAETGLNNGIRFLGYSTDDTPLTPGDARRINLFWQATAAPEGDYTAFVQLLDGQGAAIPVWEAPPGGAHPTSQWAPNTLMRTQATFRAPANLPDGRYTVITGLFRTSDGTRARAAGGKDAIKTGTVVIKGRTHNMTAPSPMFSTDVSFGSAAQLAGYSLPLWEVPPAPGETIPLTLHWQALGATDRPYTVFVHLVDEAGRVWGYGDSEPGGGLLPTTGWVAGEYIADEHRVLIAADTLSGRYRLAVGLYDPASGQRLATGDGADQAVLDEEIEVRGR